MQEKNKKKKKVHLGGWGPLQTIFLLVFYSSVLKLSSMYESGGFSHEEEKTNISSQRRYISKRRLLLQQAVNHVKLK